MMNRKIHIDADWRSLFHYGEELCGDRVMIKRSDRSFVMVLADGLGSGVKANILSTLTSTIISEMIFEQLPLKDAVETITATLPVCEDREVAYSTFTILQVDYNGKARLAQYDNPMAVILRSNQVLDIPKEEVIIHDKKIWQSEFEVQPGDHIMFFSDGILYADTEMQLNLNWGQKDVEDFLAASIQEDDPAMECTRILLAMVNSLYDGKPTDDCTVAAARILPAAETVVMVGPPVNKKDDETVMKRLMNATGQKIVCGGTTSQIAAKYLQTDVVPDTDTPMLDDVPPKAFIKGIDLVTEGQLTLQKVNFLLQKACRDRNFYDELILSKEEDGASCLVRALAESTAVTFVMGESDNAGHSGLGGISLNAKKMLIQQIGERLNELGKFVSIEKY